MTTEKQIAANRANAKHSTGPLTPEGQKSASANSLTHGLAASPETLFAAQPAEQQAFKPLTRSLRRECLPDGELEEQTFQQYAWSTFQARRARANETLTENLWLADPANPKFFSQMERMLKLGAMLERRAAKALKELRLLQRDRLVSYDIQAAHCVNGQEVPIPRSLPLAEIRKTNQHKTTVGYLAHYLAFATPEGKRRSREILENALATNGSNEPISSPTDPLALTIEELIAFDKSTRRGASNGA